MAAATNVLGARKPGTQRRDPARAYAKDPPRTLPASIGGAQHRRRRRLNRGRPSGRCEAGLSMATCPAVARDQLPVTIARVAGGDYTLHVHREDVEEPIPEGLALPTPSFAPAQAPAGRLRLASWTWDPRPRGRGCDRDAHRDAVARQALLVGSGHYRGRGLIEQDLAPDTGRAEVLPDSPCLAELVDEH